MKVLLVGRPQLAIRGSGDKIVILKTGEYLEKLGVEVEITYDVCPGYQGYDIVHLFTLSTWYAAKKAWAYGIPFILSPIWDQSVPRAVILSEKPMVTRVINKMLYRNSQVSNLLSLWLNFSRFSNLSFGKFSKAWKVSRSDYSLRRNESKYKKQILEWAKYLLPPSEFLMNSVIKEFGGFYRYDVIPFGAEVDFFEKKDEKFIKQYGLKDFILCVAAGFGYRKNQLSLIRALKGTGLSLVFVGECRTKGEERYYRKCLSESDQTVNFLPRLSEKMLASAYKAARVFALPSYFESFGLVYLEAAASGCNVVATSFSGIREHLGNLGWYCNPYDIDSIKKAVLEAYNSPKKHEAQQYILNNFTWERVAELTLEVYLKVIDGRV